MTSVSVPPVHDAGLLWAIIQSLPHAVIAVENTGRVRILNTAAKRMIGVEPEQLTHDALNRVIRLHDGRTRQSISRPFDHLLSSSSRGHRGLYDVLVRPDGTELPIEHSFSTFGDAGGAGAGVLVVLRDASRTRDVVRRLNVRASHDGLTGLVNRTEFERRLTRALANTKPGQRHALFYLDLDGFKHVNDTCGHAAGDAVLRQVARVLRMRLRANDTLARLGGDEFALLMEQCPLDTARQVARAIGWAIEARGFHFAGHRFRLSASIGVTTIDDSHRGMHQVLADADRSCYAIKRARQSRPPAVAPAMPTVSQALSC